MIDRRTFLRSAIAISTGAALTNRLGQTSYAETGRQSLSQHDTELPWRTISEVAPLLQSRAMTSVELTEFMLQRIERLDTTYNSYITVMREQALTDAQRADREIKAEKYRGPLHGIPVAVKDLCNTEGVATTAGMKILAEHTPDHDATVVTRLRKAGAVILGKLNLTEGAMGGYNRHFKLPKNPWNPDVWSGASSSGSGVATAAGLAFATLGSDTGGSIRYPSASCGIVGLKPTWGRVSRFGVFPLVPSLDHVGPMARSTADCAIVLEAIAGHDRRDSTSLVEKVPAYSRQLGKPIKKIVVGWDERYASEGVDPELSLALSDAVETLERLGTRIKPIQLPKLDELLSGWLTLAASEAALAHADYYPQQRSEYGPYFRDFLDQGTKLSGAEYAEAHQQRLECTGALRKAFREFDVLACPTMAGPPFAVPVDYYYEKLPEELFGGRDWSRFTSPFDFSGQPTLSTPCGLSSDGLPLSLQFVGKHLDEGLLCRIGHAFEQATGFCKLHPQV